MTRILGREGRIVIEMELPERSVRVPVVGESHYQEALRSICGAGASGQVRCDCIAELVPEPTNPHDQNAIMIQIDGKCIGYLSRDNAKRYRKRVLAMIEEGQPPICKAFAGRHGDDGNPNIGVSLEFPASFT